MKENGKLSISTIMDPRRCSDCIITFHLHSIGWNSTVRNLHATHQHHSRENKARPVAHWFGVTCSDGSVRNLFGSAWQLSWQCTIEFQLLSGMYVMEFRWPLSIIPSREIESALVYVPGQATRRPTSLFSYMLLHQNSHHLLGNLCEVILLSMPVHRVAGGTGLQCIFWIGGCFAALDPLGLKVCAIVLRNWVLCFWFSMDNVHFHTFCYPFHARLPILFNMEFDRPFMTKGVFSPWVNILSERGLSLLSKCLRSQSWCYFNHAAHGLIAYRLITSTMRATLVRFHFWTLDCVLGFAHERQRSCESVRVAHRYMGDGLCVRDT